MNTALKRLIRPGKTASDITPLLADGSAFHAVVAQLIHLARSVTFTKVVCVEGKGFLFGAPVAHKFSAGLVPIRHPAQLQQEFIAQTFTDFSGEAKTLAIHRDALTPDDSVIIIDDWVQTGATLKAAIALVEQSGAGVAAILALMDSSTDNLKTDLAPYRYQSLLKVSPDDRF